MANHPVNYHGATGQTLTAKFYDTSGLAASVAMTESPTTRYYVAATSLDDGVLAVGSYSVRVENAGGSILGVGTLDWSGSAEIVSVGGDIAANGTVDDAAATTSEFDVAGLALDASAYAGQFLVFTGGDLVGVAREIKNTSTGTTIVLKKPLSEAPADTTSFIIAGSA